MHRQQKNVRVMIFIGKNELSLESNIYSLQLWCSAGSHTSLIFIQQFQGPKLLHLTGFWHCLQIASGWFIKHFQTELSEQGSFFLSCLLSFYCHLSLNKTTGHWYPLSLSEECNLQWWGQAGAKSTLNDDLLPWHQSLSTMTCGD